MITQYGRTGFIPNSTALSAAMFSANYTAKDCGSPNEDTVSSHNIQFFEVTVHSLRSAIPITLTLLRVNPRG